MCEKKNEKTLAHAHTRAEQREQRDSKKNITTTGNNHKQQITNIQKACTQHTHKRMRTRVVRGVRAALSLACTHAR